jgi:hypothetical protein
MANGASFDSGSEEHTPISLSKAHQEVLDNINHWIDAPGLQSVYWLSGNPGKGKTTIGRAVASSRSDRGDLGASFFFNIGTMDRHEQNKLVPTIAHQLALKIPRVASFITETLRAEPAILEKSVKEQFRMLIEEPLSRASAMVITPPRVVMVIDALDECVQEDYMRRLINLFCSTKTVHSNLRVLLTSRPEQPIVQEFNKMQGSYQGFALDTIAVRDVEDDILVLLNDGLNKIRSEFNMTASDDQKLSPDWPGSSIVESLAQKCGSLFIMAAIICRAIGDHHGNPQKQLQVILGQQDSLSLEQLYLPLLRSQLTGLPKEEVKEVTKAFKVIVGSIVTLFTPLSPAALSGLINIPPEIVDKRLRGLHPLVQTPLERQEPVHLVHLSFRDYITTQESEFRIDENRTHHTLAKHCLRVMRGGLRQYICGLSRADIRLSAIDKVELEQHIPPELQYACMYWVQHHMKTEFDMNDSYEIHDFLVTHFFHWVEALSLLGRASDCLGSIDSLMGWLKVKLKIMS